MSGVDRFLENDSSTLDKNGDFAQIIVSSDDFALFAERIEKKRKEKKRKEKEMSYGRRKRERRRKRKTDISLSNLVFFSGIFLNPGALGQPHLLGSQTSFSKKKKNK